MSPLLVLLVAGVVLLAELPDKSMFASLVLGSRFPPRWVFAGVATAFVVHVTIAVTAGRLLRLLPSTVVDAVVAGLFLAGAAYLWFAPGDEESETAEEQAAVDAVTPSAGRVAVTAFATSFGVVFVGEWGDITQILTANLAARYHDTVSVAVGAVLGLWVAALLAITLGRTLLRYLRVRVLQRVGAVVLLGFAVFSIVQLAT